MKEPRWLNMRALLLLHAEALAEHGGLRGIRDMGALESPPARPRHVHEYETPADIAHLAAAYAYGIIQNHRFNDGNKRVGFIAAVLFLAINGFEVHCDESKAIQSSSRSSRQSDGERSVGMDSFKYPLVSFLSIPFNSSPQHFPALLRLTNETKVIFDLPSV
jgi:death on curing protein